MRALVLGLLIAAALLFGFAIPSRDLRLIAAGLLAQVVAVLLPYLHTV